MLLLSPRNRYDSIVVDKTGNNIAVNMPTKAFSILSKIFGVVPCVSEFIVTTQGPR